MRLFRLALAATLVAAVVGSPTMALADGDPASDFLLVRDVFFPYQPLVSGNLVKALTETVARSKAAGYPIKVALIASPNDLGAVPNLFGVPQRYADFLDSEIAFNGKPRLLVVMPQGFGTVLTGPVAGLHVGAPGGADALARAAMQAVPALAAQAGHRFTAPPIPRSSGSSSGGSSVALTVGAPLLLVIVVAAAATVSRRRRDRTGDAGKDGDDGQAGTSS